MDENPNDDWSDLSDDVDLPDPSEDLKIYLGEAIKRLNWITIWLFLIFVLQTLQWFGVRPNQDTTKKDIRNTRRGNHSSLSKRNKMRYFKTTRKDLPLIAFLTIDEADKADYNEIVNGNQLSRKQKDEAKRQGEYIRTNITAININNALARQRQNIYR